MTKKTPALIIVLTAVIWLAAQWLAPILGIPSIFAIMLDFLALIAFMSAMYWLWQMMSQNR